jgi:2-methylcitrate dehydratase PrpD
MKPEKTDITRYVAHLCDIFDIDSIGREVVDRSKYLLLDFLGCAIRGAISESSVPILRVARDKRSTQEPVPVIGTRERSEASYAALAIGTAAHSLELDDVVNSGSLHPAVAVMPAALTVGHSNGCSGKEVLAAIVSGYELMVKLGIALQPAAHYRQGFHPTGTCGTFGAAVAASTLMKLNYDQLLAAIGIAGSQAAGSLEFLADGSFTKRFHAGWAAHSGIIAASLAREGFSGPATILEGKFGFLHGYSPKSQPAAVIENWGQPWEIMNSSIKPHACCRYKQGPIDCIISLVIENSLRPEDVDQVEIAMLEAGFALVAEPEELKRAPRSIVDAQFSMPFGAALALVRKNAFLDRYSMEEINNPDIQALMKRVKCVAAPELDRDFPQKWPAAVTITLNDGRQFNTHLEHPKGDPENPLSWDELIEKFITLASVVLPVDQCRDIVAMVRDIDGQNDVRQLFELLRVT